MESKKSKKGILGMTLMLALVFGVGAFLATPAQAQWGGWGQWGRDRWEQQRERERQRRYEEQRRREEAERYRYDQRNYPNYGNGGYYGGYGNNRGYGSYGLSNYGRQVAQERGYQTGLDRGGDDARSGRSPNPNNSDHYRDGDSGYSSSFGNREAYKSVYREAFRRGYEQAYRQNGRYRRW